MLQLILGRSGFSKTHFVRNILFEEAKNFKNKFILLVPEQYSFENEKALLNSLGENFNDKVEVLSFKKLVRFVYKKIDKAPPKTISKSEKNILMSLAIENVKDELDLFRKVANRPEFIELMISCLNEFKMCNITDENLNTLENIDNDTLNLTLYKKILEAKLILNSYDALLKTTYLDPLDDLNLVYKILLDNNVFYDYNVIIDGFDGFTAQQLLIIERILIGSNKCYITFCLDKENSLDTAEVFTPVRKHLNRILNIAKNNSIEICPTIYLDTPKRFLNDDLKILEENIFRNNKTFSNKNPKNINLYCAQNKYDEANFVCNEIKKLIINENYRFRDIAIVTRNMDAYKGILDIYLNKYNIPYFMNKNENIDSKPLMKFVINAINVIRSNFSSESIMKYLKSGILNFSTEEISIVENYALTWDISKEEWKSNFSKNPNGISFVNDEKTTEMLEKINALREKIITPLLNFENNLKDADAFLITKAIYTHLEEVNTRENLKNISEKLIESNNIRLAEEQIKLWDMLMDILDYMAKTLKNKKISLKRYLELLILVINSNELAFIPKSLDEINIGNADRFKNDHIKVLFLIGASQGEFPRTPATSGIFKDDERKQLLALGFDINDPLEKIAINEKFLAYKTTSIPSEKIFVSYPGNSITGEQKKESEIVTELKSIFKNIKELNKYSFDLKDEVFAIKPSFEILSKHFKDNSRFSETLKKYFKEVPEYKDKINSLEKISANKLNRFKNINNINLLIENNLKVSPSSIEQYYMCPFSFFCKYILLAKKNKRACFDALEFGNLVHYLLEKIFSSFSPDYLLNITQKELKEIVNQNLDNYVSKKFNNVKNLPKRFQYLIKRTASTTVPLILHIAEELNQSKFSPKAFEMAISNNSKIKPLNLELKTGEKIEISGKIDRIDIMEKDSINYVRIVDYKTGTKEFKLSDIDYGLNIQMLLYLYIILNNGKKIYKSMIPSGILYMPAKKPVITFEKDTLKSKIEDQKSKKLRMNGLILDSTDVILGMEANGQGKYIPAIIKDGEPKKSDSLVSLNEMKNILNQIRDLVLNMGEKIFKSDISPLPLKGNTDACEYCEFSSICGFEENDPCRNKS